MSRPCVLVLGGLDPSGGAGLLADADAVRAAGARPLCVATALTAQTLRRAAGFQVCAPTFLVESARLLLDEEDVRAVKIGMLAGPQTARAIADLLATRPELPLVLDPVLAASSGLLLFKGTPDDARAAIAGLWGRAVVTPNGPEAALLLGMSELPRTPDAQEEAARALVRAGALAALVKGGHAEGAEAVDVLAERGAGSGGSGSAGSDGAAVTVSRLRGPRSPHSARGTGCRFASALAAGLARGLPLQDAALGAKQLVSAYLHEQGAGARADAAAATPEA